MQQKRISECAKYPMTTEKQLIEKYDELLRGSDPYLLVSINIKNFKFINIKYGWEQGNEILYLVYQTLQKQLLDGEYAAYRSEDNFVLLLRSLNWNMSQEAAHKYIQAVLIPYLDAIFEIDDKRIHKNIYASFGIYPFYIKKTSYFEALEMAELFRKNDRGIKHRIFTLNFYDQSELEGFKNEYELGVSTATALQLGEYKIYVQPKVDVKTRKIVGGEALLRRFDASDKMIPLSEFFPILVDEGYIRKIDWFVFESACKIMSDRYTSAKPIVPISFNVSKDFFYDPLSCDDYVSTQKKYDFPQKYIELELMETISLDDTRHMIEVIETFRRAGFKCSLDDFGNGYSSFAVLLNAKLDYVKIDRVFFNRPLDEVGRKVLENVIAILKFLKVQIVAEGVETEEYVDLLAELGCDIIQGYYFYKPMPIEEFMQLLDEQG